MKRFTLMVKSLIALGAACLIGDAAAQDKGLVVGLIATTTEAEAIKNWQPLLDDMSAELRMPVSAIAAKDYGAIVKALGEGKVQLAWLGQKAALQAVMEANAEVIAHHVKADGSKGYSALLLANKTNPIKSLDEVVTSPGKYTLALGKPSSTSGFLIPVYNIVTKNNLEFKTHFKRMQTGSHLDNFLAVANGTVDLATNNTEDFDNFKTSNPAEYGKVKVIWKSDPIGLDPMLIDKRLPSDQKQAVVKFLVGYGKNSKEKAHLMQACELGGFAKANNKLLGHIATLEAFYEQYSLMNDDSLSAEQKDAKFKVLFKRHGDMEKLFGGS
jgi:phosphonate transport system substrate-binding protein